ncbi:MAG: D-alanyl-D-alanine carboxypeptidase family protein [Armatimonadota bacterium]|nr:D-alanyl-D-alanine carboxypeptidase family protein [Armatimonadota bacterium]MDR7590314.1 D-alanyl-D-alanine carboxypeptidase family protein [Armatimonadota bacterium]
MKAAVLAALLAAAPLRPGQLGLQATAFLLMEARTGQVLTQHNARVVWPPASTTKILTALLVAESLDPDAVVTVSRRAASQRQGAGVGLRAGERRSVRDLFYAMLLASANDAAVALAEAAAGSVEDFVQRMNRRARELGARHTHFVNPHGLYHPLHRSTAYDLAVLARAALHNPRVAEAVAAPEYLYPGEAGPRRLVNRNRLLFTYPGASGVKTGWIAESGPCLVASARRGDRTLIAVVLNSPRVFEEASRLLDFGFDAYEVRVLARPQQPVAETELPGGGTLQATVAVELVWSVPRGSRVQLQPRWEVGLQPPVRAGQPVGQLDVVVDGQVQVQVPLVAVKPVEARPSTGGLWRWLWELVRRR